MYYLFHSVVEEDIYNYYTMTLVAVFDNLQNLNKYEDNI